MKADVKPDSREKEALEWATEFFREHAADIKKGARPRGIDDLLRQFNRCFDLYEDGMDRVGRELLASRLERGEPLSDGYREQVIECLRSFDNKRNGRPGRSRFDFLSRDTKITQAVIKIVRTWGIRRTRNDATTKRQSAASIVQEALKRGANIKLKEREIHKICRHWRYAEITEDNLLKNRSD